MGNGDGNGNGGTKTATKAELESDNADLLSACESALDSLEDGDIATAISRLREVFVEDDDDDEDDEDEE